MENVKTAATIKQSNWNGGLQFAAIEKILNDEHFWAPQLSASFTGRQVQPVRILAWLPC